MSCIHFMSCIQAVASVPFVVHVVYPGRRLGALCCSCRVSRPSPRSRLCPFSLQKTRSFCKIGGTTHQCASAQQQRTSAMCRREVFGVF